MPAQLYAGQLATFDVEDSMARSIEQALTSLMGPLPSAPETLVNDRRILFLAIARGVINHLKLQENAFRIEFDVGVHHVNTTPDIDVRPS
jgi:hypothetical protein